MTSWVEGMKAMRDKLADIHLAAAAKEQAGHRERLANAGPVITDDVEDVATAETRKNLKLASAAKREEAQEAIQAANSVYFERLSSVAALTDSKIWDDGEGSAGAMRSVVAAQSEERKKKEAAELAKRNKGLKERLANVEAKTDDGDGKMTSDP